MPEWITSIIDLFYNDTNGFIKENIYIFSSYTVICVSIALSINKAINSKQRKKNKEKTKELEDKIFQLESENSILREQFATHGIKPLLMAGTKLTSNPTTAKLISKSITNKNNKKNNKKNKKKNKKKNGNK